MYHIPIYWNKDKSKKKTAEQDDNLVDKGHAKQENIESHGVDGETINHNNADNNRLEEDLNDHSSTEENSTLTKTKHNILFISPNLPDFDQSAGGKRAFLMLKLLQETYNVYAYAPGERPSKHQRKLEEVGVTVISHHDYTRIKREVPLFESIIYAWYYTYYDCAGFRDLYPEALIIVDTVDIHWVREARSIGNWEGIDMEKMERNKLSEIHVYQNANIIWTVSDTDTAAIKKEVPDSDIRVVSIIEEMNESSYTDPLTNNILFIGGYSHYPNINAAKIIANEILPIIEKKVPGVKLLLAGSKAPDEIIELGNQDNIEYLGFINDEDIPALYAKSFMAIVPLVSGAGVKGKICEAISYRLPVVTNKIGNEGINLKNKTEAFITESPLQMSKYAIQLLNRKVNLEQLTSNAQAKLKGLVGVEVNRTNMLNSIHRPVSICIVTFNKVDLLEKCINSIIKYTSYPQYEILVHSNGCKDGTKEYLQEISRTFPQVIPIISEDNNVFVLPNNWMMERSSENDIVLLNNDTIVTQDWLSELKKAAYSSPTIGIAGSKILYPDGKLQEFGGELYMDGTGRNIGKWEDPNQEQYSQLKRASFVSGCSFFIKRSTINKVGVFDKQFHPCYCEDADYCYNAWSNGLETVVTPKSIIYHFEGATSGTDTSSGFKKYQDINMKKLYAKHGNSISITNDNVSEINNSTSVIR